MLSQQFHCDQARCDIKCGAEQKGTHIAASTRCHPCAFLKQAWVDYKNGRQMRKNLQHEKEQEHQRQNFPVYASESGDARNEPHSRQPKSSPGWHRQNGAYPWRIEKTIQGDTNWRGTWILEVKDIFDVTWERQKIHDGKKWKMVSIPASHWPES